MNSRRTGESSIAVADFANRGPILVEMRLEKDPEDCTIEANSFLVRRRSFQRPSSKFLGFTLSLKGMLRRGRRLHYKIAQRVDALGCTCWAA